MSFQLIEQLQHKDNAVPVEQLCRVLEVSRPGYYAARKRRRIPPAVCQASVHLKAAFAASGGAYGYRRMRASLSSQCMHICEKVVQRLMNHERLVAATPKRRRYGSYLGEISPAPENLVNRNFTAGAPNEKWLTDISEFHIPAGKVYLSPVIDCFDGKEVSWTIGMRPDAPLVNTMLDAAIETIDISSNGPVVHSDRGAHYRWPGWLARIADAELTRSM